MASNHSYFFAVSFLFLSHCISIFPSHYSLFSVITFFLIFSFLSFPVTFLSFFCATISFFLFHYLSFFLSFFLSVFLSFHHISASAFQIVSLSSQDPNNNPQLKFNRSALEFSPLIYFFYLYSIYSFSCPLLLSSSSSSSSPTLSSSSLFSLLFFCSSSSLFVFLDSFIFLFSFSPCLFLMLSSSSSSSSSSHFFFALLLNPLLLCSGIVSVVAFPVPINASESCLSISLSINPPYFFLASSKFYYHFSIYSSRFFSAPIIRKDPLSHTLFDDAFFSFFLFRALPFQTLILAYISSLRQQFHGFSFYFPFSQS
ncbi:unnamed protein product [Acanthosepion pharaonis]|uniref:Uncharacterized protein n=1 Tax=Acanthosepion pharaonis TaxID=158019 RepID=A0A812BCU2_ACAPH|nr:unnamed protein product [Sepia pharaonis]